MPSSVRRASPLIVLAVIELIIVLLTPGKSSTQAGGANNSSSSSAASTGAQGGAGALVGTGTPGAPGAPGTVSGPGGAAGGAAGGGSTSTGAGTTAGGSSTGGGSTGTSGGTTAGGGSLNKFGYASTDMSKCGRDGLQAMPEHYRPPCRPVWHGGDNGGATMTGVSGNQIHFLYYISQANAQVNALLNQEQLAATPKQFCAALSAFTDEINKRFEAYGRTFVSIDGKGNHSGKAEANDPSCKQGFFQGQCSLTPPDQPCLRAEADTIAKEYKPAFVLVPSADPNFAYELAHDGIIVYSGIYGPESYHEQLAPYLYEVSMNGTQNAELTGEYYCKKLAKKPVRFAGPEVTGGIPSRAPVRKLGIIYPENNGDVTIKVSAQLLASIVNKCSGTNSTQLYPYESDINRAQVQATQTVGKIKQTHVTTVACLCDPIAPVFLSNAFEQQTYRPEIFSVGTGLLDYDALAQLYNQDVWRYAFGVSLLGNTVPFGQSDAVKAWNDAGRSGQPDKTENLGWTFMQVMANAVQNTGPKLTPQNMHAALVNAPQEEGNPDNPLYGYHSPWNWSVQKDAREVWWCPTRTSPLNGKPGTYVPVDGGKRYQLGQWTSALNVFQNGTPCA